MMPIKTILFLCAMSVSAISWFVWNMVYYSKTTRKAISKDGFRIHVQCEKCGMQYDIPIKAFLKKHYMKERSVTKIIHYGPVIGSEQIVTFMAKKFDCPHCLRPKWAKILNMNEYYERYKNFFLKSALMQILIALIGAVQLFLLFGYIALTIQI